MSAPPPCRCWVLLVDALHGSAAAGLRHALSRFANLLALGAAPERPMDVGLALVIRSGAGVQLQVVYKPSRFLLRDFQAAVTRLRPHEAWAAPDTRKLVLALRSLVQHLAASSTSSSRPSEGPKPPHPPSLAAPGPALSPTRVVVVAHSFVPPPGGLLGRVLEEAAHALVSVSFLALNTEHSIRLFRTGFQAGETDGGDGGGGGKGGYESTDVSALEAAAAAAAATFGRAVAPHENADQSWVMADPLTLEQLTASWAHQLISPLRPPTLSLVVPACTSGAVGGGAAGGATLAGGGATNPAGPSSGGAGADCNATSSTAANDGGGSRDLVVPCQLSSQLSYLNPRCQPCPLCVCHGLPTLPLPPRGPHPSYCPASPGDVLLPPAAAPLDPLTVRLGGPGQELRLAGRGPLGPGGRPQGVVDENFPYDSGDGPLGGGEVVQAPQPPTRLVVDRVVHASEVNEAVVYGWPQVLCACESYDGQDEYDEAREAGGPYGKGDGGGAAPPVVHEQLAALAQVLQRRGSALVAWCHSALCEGRSPLLLTSLRQWYLLMPGPGCFLLRQLACREQLVPLQPPPGDTSPTALAAAIHTLEQLPGWGDCAAGGGVGAGIASPPAGPGGGKATPGSLALSVDGVGRVAGEEAGSEKGNVAGAVGGDAGGNNGTGVAVAGGAGRVNGGGESVLVVGAGEEKVVGTSAAAAVLGADGAAVPHAAVPSFSPLMLSSGCHELLTSLLRDSVRLTPRVVHPPPADLAPAAPAPAAAASSPPVQPSPSPSGAGGGHGRGMTAPSGAEYGIGDASTTAYAEHHRHDQLLNHHQPQQQQPQQQRIQNAHQQMQQPQQPLSVRERRRLPLPQYHQQPLEPPPPPQSPSSTSLPPPPYSTVEQPPQPTAGAVPRRTRSSSAPPLPSAAPPPSGVRHSGPPPHAASPATGMRPVAAPPPPQTRGRRSALQLAPTTTRG